MSVEFTTDKKVNIKFRAGTTQPVSVTLTYFASSTAQGVPLDLTTSTFKFVVYDAVTGKSILTINMPVVGSTATCNVKSAKKLSSPFAITRTDGEVITDIVTGNLEVF